MTIEEAGLYPKDVVYVRELIDETLSSSQ